MTGARIDGAYLHDTVDRRAGELGATVLAIDVEDIALVRILPFLACATSMRSSGGHGGAVAWVPIISNPVAHRAYDIEVAW